jgi:hypothetical protein
MSTTTISGGSLIETEGVKMPIISTEMSDNRTVVLILWGRSSLSHTTTLT